MQLNEKASMLSSLEEIEELVGTLLKVLSKQEWKLLLVSYLYTYKYNYYNLLYSLICRLPRWGK